MKHLSAGVKIALCLSVFAVGLTLVSGLTAYRFRAITELKQDAANGRTLSLTAAEGTRLIIQNIQGAISDARDTQRSVVNTHETSEALSELQRA